MDSVGKGARISDATLLEEVRASRKELNTLNEELTHAREGASQAVSQKERMAAALQEARDQIAALKEEVDKLCAPPSTYGVYLSVNGDGTVNVLSQGRKVKVSVHPAIKVETLKPGQELILNEGLNVVEAAGYEIQGEVVILKEQLDEERAIVTLRADEDKVGIIADPLRLQRLKVGDHILMDGKSGYLLEKLPKSEVEDLALEEVPDIGYESIGGLGTQIETIKDAVELPYLYADYYKEHKLTPPKGVLLYGPPGCGKTMIAKAVANNLAEKISEKRGEKIKGYFLNIKGPELLNKYVGETERKIREIFVKAKEKANEDVPVVVFFDEMDALFRTRGTGISSDVESTIVPQLLAEDRRGRRPQERHRDRRQQPPGPDRPRGPASGPARREDQGRAPGPGRGGRHLQEVSDHRASDRRARDPGGRRCRGGGRRHGLHRGRHDVPPGRREPVPRGHLRQRRDGDAVLQGLRLGRHDRVDRAPGQEARAQALHQPGRQGHQQHGPGHRGARGVQGERGPAEHEQSRRLGEDRRPQEGPDRRHQTGRRRPPGPDERRRADRHHGPVPVSEAERRGARSGRRT